MDESKHDDGRAKEYQRIKQRLSLFHLGWTPLLLSAIAFSPLSMILRDYSLGIFAQPYAALAVYFLLFSLVFLVFDLPFAFYSGYVVEHRYSLSNQSLSNWISFFLKRAVLSFLFSLALLAGLYFFIWSYSGSWWFLAWAGYAVVSVVIGKIFPVFIVPLFYRYDPITDEGLKERIFGMARRYAMPVENVYSLNLSKTTKKANAAFMGMGKTRRVVLSDTLLDKFSPDEIETVVAHELGHYRHRDIVKQLVFGMTASAAAFWLAFRTFSGVAESAGLAGSGDIAALPLLFLIFYLFSLVLTPAQSAFSRWLERAADRFSLEVFPHPDIFISCMEKLGKVNMADPSPHPLYEWFFYDHPSIGKRVEMARRWKSRA